LDALNWWDGQDERDGYAEGLYSCGCVPSRAFRVPCTWTTYVIWIALRVQRLLVQLLPHPGKYTSPGHAHPTSGISYTRGRRRVTPLNGKRKRQALSSQRSAQNTSGQLPPQTRTDTRAPRSAAPRLARRGAADTVTTPCPLPLSTSPSMQGSSTQGSRTARLHISHTMNTRSSH